MKTSIDFVSDIEKVINELLQYSVGLELENSKLKRVIKILAKSFSLDQDGNTVTTLTENEVAFIKDSCEKYNVFGGGN